MASPADWTPGDYAISVARVSDEIQTTIPDQHRMNHEGSQLIGLPIPEDGYFEDTITRSTSDRPGWRRAQERMLDPRCRALIVTWPSRAFGDMEQTMSAYRFLTRNNIGLFDPHGREEDVASHIGRLIGAIKGWQSEGEVIETRKRVSETHRSRAALGRLMSRPPFGTRAVEVLRLPCQGECVEEGRGCPTRHSEVSKKGLVLVVVPEHQALLLRIFTWIAEGRGLRALEDVLAAEDVRSPVRIVRRGKRKGLTAGGTLYSKAHLYRMIRYRFYRGDMEWGRIAIKHDGPERWVERLPEEQLIIRSHALGPLVPVELWDEANRWIDVRASAKQEESRYPELMFDGLVYCGRCGAKMTPARRGQRLRDGSRTEKYDYRCPGKTILLSPCRKRNHVMPEHWLLPLLDGQIVRHQMRDVEVTFSPRGDGAARKQRVAATRAELAGLETQLANIKQMTKVGLYTIEEGLRETAGVERRTAALHEELRAALSTPVEQPTIAAPRDLADLVPLLSDASLPLVERKRSLLRLVDRVVIDRPSIRVELRPQVSET